MTPEPVSSAYAVVDLLAERWPSVPTIALVPIGTEVDRSLFTSVVTVEDYCNPYEPRSLIPSEQVTLALPGLLRSLLEEYETVIWCGRDVLPTGIPLPELAGPVTLGIEEIVRPMDSLTPHLEDLDHRRSPTPDSRLVIAQPGAEPFLEAWMSVCGEAVLDFDQRSVDEHAKSFLGRAHAHRGVTVNGSDLLMMWADYAAVAAQRAEGVLTPFVTAGDLFEKERQLRAKSTEECDGGDFEVDWPIVIHRVHDQRPITFLQAAVAATPVQPLRRSERVDNFVAEVRRAADPFGWRWSGADSDRQVREWLLETNQYGMTRASELVIRNTFLWEEFPRARYQPSEYHTFLDAGGTATIGFDTRTLRPAPVNDGRSVREQSTNPIRWRWNLLRQTIPGAARRERRAWLNRVAGPDVPSRKRVASPTAVAVERDSSMWGSPPRSLTLIGPLRAQNGLGEAARATLEALRLLDRPFSHIDTSEKYPTVNTAPTGLDWSTHGNTGDINLIHNNAEEVLTYTQSAFRHRLGGRFNAAMWFWETAALPDGLRPAFDFVDELWVASDYLVDVFGQYGQVPVRSIGLASKLPDDRVVDRAELGFDEDDFVFLFVYDAFSSFGRKNPAKALRAFIQAFAPGFDGVRFILKARNLSKYPASHAEIMRLAQENPAISVIDRELTRGQVLDLMAAADIYVSLHAAEGYGLTMLESMALGTPTICTGYSGNMGFTNSDNSWLVDYELVSIDEAAGPYPVGSTWASPNVDTAAEFMRLVVDDRGEVARKAELARRDAHEAASPERYAARLDAELRRVGA
ncbi:MAG: glycosyltransferase [Acidimicrobiia bacterium]